MGSHPSVRCSVEHDKMHCCFDAAGCCMLQSFASKHHDLIGLECDALPPACTGTHLQAKCSNCLKQGADVNSYRSATMAGRSSSAYAVTMFPR